MSKFPKLTLLANAASSHTQKWALDLAKRGWQIDVFSFLPAEIPGVTVHHIPKLLGGKADAILRSRWVRKRLAEIQPDIVHAHYATSFGLLGALSGCHPLVISAWGSDIFSFPRSSVLHRSLLHWILKNADQLCSTSQVMAQEMLLYTNNLQKEIAVIPFGVDVDRFTPPVKKAVNLGLEDGESASTVLLNTELDNTELGNSVSGLESEQVIYGVAKHLHSVYGLDILIQAFALVHSRHPGKVRLRIAGDGPEKEKLMQLTREYQAEEAVEWVGHLPNTEVADFYRSLDVVVVPSRKESFGVTAVEGAACGRPVIGSNIEGLPEVILDGKTGILAPPENPQKLAEAMELLLLDSKQREQMGEAGRRFVLEKYDWQKNVSQMEAVYLSLLNRPRIG